MREVVFTDIQRYHQQYEPKPSRSAHLAANKEQWNGARCLDGQKVEPIAGDVPRQMQLGSATRMSASPTTVARQAAAASVTGLILRRRIALANAVARPCLRAFLAWRPCAKSIHRPIQDAVD